MRINFEISAAKWKPMSEGNLEPERPYWFKKSNGDIVMATYISNAGMTGWAVTYFDRDKFVCETNTFHILKGAEYQDAI